MASIRSILVCEAQVPFVRGGAEYHVRQLVDRLREHGYAVDMVSMPFKWYPKEEILAHAAAWRLLDLSESNGVAVDMVIATKFPCYFARHPNKVAWLCHQYRAAYELCGTAYSDFDHVDADVGLRQTLLALDTDMLRECRGLFTIARNTANRLAKYNGLQAETLYHPPRLADRFRRGPGQDYVLSVGRLESVKRVDLAIRAIALAPPPLRLVIAGIGTQLANLQRLVEELGVGDRVTFSGSVDDDTLLGLYADALAVVFAPFDEDYGYVTLEAFLAHKPVVTAIDSGGPLEFVQDQVNGCVCEPSPESMAGAFARFSADPAHAAALGEAGYERARLVTWDGVIETLVGTEGSGLGARGSG
ncbi:MAG: glycosyltransferase family 4 protein [Acidobacteria bacterium]|nr:glycosyltransferase family 4 protein [Acidobacteriota bacterium]